MAKIKHSRTAEIPGDGTRRIGPASGTSPVLHAPANELPGDEGNGDTPKPKPLTEIGIGKPLSLKITSIFPGSAEWHDRERIGGTLVTSAVRNPMFKAVPRAMHYYFQDVPAGEVVRPSPSDGGSNVVYYTPGLIHSSLDVEVRMAFDRFDPAKLALWTDAVGKISNLPIFAALTGNGTAAIVYAISNALQFASRAIDDWFDDDEDWISTWTLPVDEAGFVPARSAFILFYGDREPQTVSGPGGKIIGKEFDYRDKQYVVNLQDGTLRYRNDRQRQVLEGDPYVLALLNGREQQELKKWAPSAVSAVLYERFFRAEDGSSKDLVEVAEAFNDIMMAKEVSSLNEELSKMTPAERKKSDQLKKRDGALKNIQDEKIAEMLKDS